jgi:hypothetical protein
MPQLIYVAADVLPPDLENADPEAASGRASGTQPGQIPGQMDTIHTMDSPGGIAWRPALNAALLLAAPTGILCFGLLPIGLFWMVASAAWAVGIYARRVRPPSLTLGQGVRIGMMTGLFTSWLTVSLYGIGFWFTRYVLHQGGEWDSMWANQVMRSNEQMLAEMGTGNAESLQMAASIKAMMLSPQGRAGLPFTGLLVLAMFLVFFSIIGGALGARMQATGKRRRS